MSNFPHLAQRLFNVPVAILPDKAEIIIAALADRLGVTQMFRDGALIGLAPLAHQFEQSPDDDREARDYGYEQLAGVAIIRVAGTLVQKNGSLRPSSGMTGYDGLRQNFLAALNDSAVRAIVMDIDSPGGEVAGCFDLVDMIYQARGSKPVHAILNENAFSAAYALASACDRITVPRTGGTGSIGVICCHVDWSKALAKEGIAVTFIQYGARKSDFVAEKPLTDDARARAQLEINQMGELFVETVARNRKISAAKVRGMEAGTFLGAAGVAAGLADAVMAPDAAFRSLVESLT